MEAKMAKWGTPIQIDRKPTGVFCKALVGQCKEKIGEIVYYHRWGDIDLRFDDGNIVTFANDNVSEVQILKRREYV